MDKEDFVKYMSLIQNYDSERQTLSILIDKITDGRSVVTMGEYLVDAILNIIKKDLKIEDENLLTWWLWDGSEKKIYYPDGDKEISVETLEQLYDYITKKELLIKVVAKDNFYMETENKEQFLTKDKEYDVLKYDGEWFEIYSDISQNRYPHYFTVSEMNKYFKPIYGIRTK